MFLRASELAARVRGEKLDVHEKRAFVGSFEFPYNHSLCLPLLREGKRLAERLTSARTRARDRLAWTLVTVTLRDSCGNTDRQLMRPAISLRPPRCVSTGPVFVRLAERANERERE